MWQVRVDKVVVKRLSRIPNPDNARIQRALNILKSTPEILDIKPLKGSSNYRLRIGSWRIIMSIDFMNKIFNLHDLVSRGDIYKN